MFVYSAGAMFYCANLTGCSNMDDVQHAISLELLSDRLVEGATVLDVGSGSGYLTACMSIMVSYSLFCRH